MRKNADRLLALARRGRAAIKRRLRPAPPERQDELLTWMRFAVPGMLAEGNIASIERAMRNLPGKGDLLEIGSFAGLSTNIISTMMRRHGHSARRLFTCDRWLFEGSERGHLGNSAIPHVAYRDFVRDTYLRSTQLFSSELLPHTIEAFSDDFFALWERGALAEDVFQRPVQLGGPLAFCFIDGNHTYEFALRDFDNTDRWLVAGGFILFDDSGDDSGWEVNRVVRDVALKRGYDVVDANPNYLLRKRG